jgi:hypothetical protein
MLGVAGIMARQGFEQIQKMTEPAKHATGQESE